MVELNFHPNSHSFYLYTHSPTPIFPPFHLTPNSNSLQVRLLLPHIFARSPIVPVDALDCEPQSLYQPSFELRSAALDIFPLAADVVGRSVEIHDDSQLLVPFLSRELFVHVSLDHNVDVQHSSGVEIDSRARFALERAHLHLVGNSQLVQRLGNFLVSR